MNEKYESNKSDELKLTNILTQIRKDPTSITNEDLSLLQEFKKANPLDSLKKHLKPEDFKTFSSYIEDNMDKKYKERQELSLKDFFNQLSAAVKYKGKKYFDDGDFSSLGQKVREGLYLTNNNLNVIINHFNSALTKKEVKGKRALWEALFQADQERRARSEQTQLDTVEPQFSHFKIYTGAHHTKDKRAVEHLNLVAKLFLQPNMICTATTILNKELYISVNSNANNKITNEDYNKDCVGLLTLRREELVNFIERIQDASSNKTLQKKLIVDFSAKLIEITTKDINGDKVRMLGTLRTQLKKLIKDNFKIKIGDSEENLLSLLNKPQFIIPAPFIDKENNSNLAIHAEQALLEKADELNISSPLIGTSKLACQTCFLVLKNDERKPIFTGSHLGFFTKIATYSNGKWGAAPEALFELGAGKIELLEQENSQISDATLFSYNSLDVQVSSDVHVDSDAQVDFMKPDFSEQNLGASKQNNNMLSEKRKRFLSDDFSNSELSDQSRLFSAKA